MSLPVHLQIFQVFHRSSDNSCRGRVRRYRRLSKDGRSDEMQDRVAHGPLPPDPTVQIGLEVVILPVPNMCPRT